MAHENERCAASASDKEAERAPTPVSVTVPFVLPEEIRLTMQRLAALRSAQGRRDGQRGYSMSSLAREIFAAHLDAWGAELEAGHINLSAERPNL